MFNRKLISKKKIIVSDGIAGGGKLLICNLLSSLPQVDQWIADPTIEQQVALNKLKISNLDTCSYIIKTNHNRTVYDSSMMRSSNFRKSDRSSVTNHPRFKSFKKRMGSNDEKIYKKNENKIFTHYLTHMTSNSSEAIFKAFESKLIFIQLLRSPLTLEMILHLVKWSKKWEKIKSRDGYVKLYNKNYRKNYPYFINERHKEYLKANYFEKAVIILSYIYDQKKSDLSNFKKKYKSRVVTIPFEKLIVDPYFYIKKISRILNVKIDNVVKKTMKKNNVPRKFDFEKNQNLGFEFIKNKIRKKYLNELIGINQFYEKKYLGQFK